MRKLLLALLLALASAMPALSQPAVNGCNKNFFVNQAATSITKILSGVAGQHFELCGYAINTGVAAGSVTLTYGTGTNCNANTVVFVPAIALGINGVYVDHITFPHIPIPAVAGGVPVDICLTTVGAGPTNVIIYYAQF
jgi:hypothetical protein